MEQSALTRWLDGEVAQRPLHQVEQLRRGVFRFCDQIEHLGEVRAERNRLVAVSQAFEGVFQHHLL